MSILIRQTSCHDVRCIASGKESIYRNYNRILINYIHNGFGFDTIPVYKPSSNINDGELDDVSRTSIKTLPFPSGVKEKLFTLIKKLTKKKDIDNYGSYISKRMAIRRCVEVPRILPSVLLDPDSGKNMESIKKLSKNPRFRHLYDLYMKNKLGPNEQAQIELSNAEDARHKNTSISFSPQIAIAHTAHTFFGYYAVCLRIFSELNKRVPNIKISKIMFYNAGSGASIIAANTIWDLNKCDNVLVVEPSENLLKICKYLLPELNNVQYQMNIYETRELFDIIVLPYCMIDIRGTESRSLLVRNLWNKLNIGGIIVIIESGTPTGFRIIHSLRELFISRLDINNFHFIAPCPHEGICPLALTGKDWCHFSQRIYRIPHYIYKKGSISRSIDNEKYSYLVVGKYKGPRTLYKNESNAPTAVDKSYFWPRVVLPPLKLGRRVLIDVCSLPNNFKRLIVPKNTPESSGYKYARDTLWGDLWRFIQREEKPIARGYVPDDVKDYLLDEHNRELNINKKLQRLNPSIEEEIKEDMMKNYSS